MELEMNMQPNLVHQDLRNQSVLQMERNKIRNELAKVQKCSQKVKNGKKHNSKILSLQKQLEELNKQIKVENLQLEKAKINSPDIRLSQEKGQQLNKLEVQGDKNSLEGTNTLNNSPSETGSDVESGNFSLRGRNLSKTNSPCERYQKK